MTMSRRIMIAMVLAVIFSLSAVGSASAITRGELDGEGHPYVGLMVAQDEDGNPLWRCSGTLIAPELFLTAGHCTDAPAAHVEIWFDADLESGIPENGYPYTGDVGGTPYTHPDYDPNAFFLHDLGVVVLDEPVYMDEYGVLPEENQLDGLATRRGLQNVTFTAVGYGLQNANKNHTQAERVRMVAYPRLIQINTPGFTSDFAILLTNNSKTGGTCFGDSGGPIFIGDTNVLAGVTSFGLNSNCAGTGGDYRLDQADDLNWLSTEFGNYLN